jgi:hypothetical protein
MKLCAWRALIAEHRFRKGEDDVYEKEGILHVLGALDDDAVESLVRDRVAESLPLGHEVLRLTIVIDDEHPSDDAAES